VPAYIDFKNLAERIDIEEVARSLGVHTKRGGKELRAACPRCESEDARALQILPETNSYRCYAAGISGDCISLHAHIKGVGMYQAAKALQEHFRTAAAGGEPATTPTRPVGGTAAKAQPASTKLPAPERAFDPEEYAAKLQYTDAIEALGITKEDAQTLGIGYASTGVHRGSVVIAIRHPTGEIAGFAGIKGEVKLPSKWLQPKVVELKKRA
jgi:DNA primase